MFKGFWKISKVFFKNFKHFFKNCEDFCIFMCSIHSAESNAKYGHRSVGPRERIFTQNDNSKKCSSIRELLNCENWGGAGPPQAHKVAKFGQFWKQKNSFLRLEGGRWGGRRGGRWKWGAGGGAIFGIHGGALGGRSKPLWGKLEVKNDDFLSAKGIFLLKISAPPCAPPVCELSILKIEGVVIHQNQKSYFFDNFSGLCPLIISISWFLTELGHLRPLRWSKNWALIPKIAFFWNYVRQDRQRASLMIWTWFLVRWMDIAS